MPFLSSEVRSFAFAPMRKVQAFMERLQQEANLRASEDASTATHAAAANSSNATAAPAISSGAHPYAGLAQHPTLFRLKLSELQERLAEVTLQRNQLQPKFATLVTQSLDVSDKLERVKSDALALRTEVDGVKKQNEETRLVLEKRREKNEALKLCHSVLQKHRVCWEILSDHSARDADFLKQSKSHAINVAKAWMKREGILEHAELTEEQQESLIMEVTAAYSSHLLHLETTGSTDPLAHQRLLTFVQTENLKSTRLHLAKVAASYFQRRIGSLDQLRKGLQILPGQVLTHLESRSQSLQQHAAKQVQDHQRAERQLEKYKFQFEMLKGERKKAAAAGSSASMQLTNSIAKSAASSKPSFQSTGAHRAPLTGVQQKRKRAPSARGDENRSTNLPSAATASTKATNKDSSSTLQLLPLTIRPAPLPSHPAAAYREHAPVLPASQAHSLLPAHAVLLPNHRAIEEMNNEREMEDIMGKLWD